MLKLALVGFAAWAPGLEDEAAWRRWAAAPTPLGVDGAPSVDFLPSLLRRRCDRLTRMLLRAARDACGDGEWSCWPSVFASRHGSVTETLSLLDDLAAERPLSPTRFSHSVHNAPAGLFAIAAGNRAPSSTIAAGPETFPSALFEAAACLERTRAPGVLLVAGDEPIAPRLARFVDEPAASYAVACRLAREDCGGRLLRIEPAPAGEPSPAPPWPLAVELLRAVLRDEPEARVGRLRVRIGADAVGARGAGGPVSRLRPSA